MEIIIKDTPVVNPNGSVTVNFKAVGPTMELVSSLSFSKEAFDSLENELENFIYEDLKTNVLTVFDPLD